MKRRVLIALATAATLTCGSTPVVAQESPLLGRLATLLTEQRDSGAYVPDPAAAAATTNTVASLFLVELGTLPMASSSGGFVYRLRPDLGVFERASSQFGPFFTERTLNNSRGQASIGFSYQTASFGSLQGADLRGGTFPTNAARVVGAIDPFSVDTLALKLSSRSITPFASYGVTDRLSVGGALPIVNARFSGQRMRTVNGTATLQSAQSGSATGIGDAVINGRYLVAGTGVRGLSVGSDIRFPTGRQEDLLGTSDVGARFLAVGSWERGQLALHGNAGGGIGGVSREWFWSTATTYAVAPRLTLGGEFIGRRLESLNRVSDVYQPHPVLAGVETMRWLPTADGVGTAFIVTGAKWNIARSWLVNANMLIRLTDAGLRSRVTPSVSLDYAFER